MSSNQGTGCLSLFRKKSEKNKENLPYAINEKFLTPDEFSFYQLAVQVLQEKYTVCPKVALAELLRVTGNDPSAWNKINQKRIDFVVCDSQTMKPVYAIELDDSTHKQKKRQERDQFLDAVFKAANLLLIHVIDRNSYSREELIEQLVQPLNRFTQYGTSTPVSDPQIQDEEEPAQEAPHCPKCGKPTILRTSSKTGKKFWVCINYPLCKGMIPVSDR